MTLATSCSQLFTFVHLHRVAQSLFCLSYQGVFASLLPMIPSCANVSLPSITSIQITSPRWWWWQCGYEKKIWVTAVASFVITNFSHFYKGRHQQQRQHQSQPNSQPPEPTLCYCQTLFSETYSKTRNSFFEE